MSIICRLNTFGFFAAVATLLVALPEDGKAASGDALPALKLAQAETDGQEQAPPEGAPQQDDDEQKQQEEAERAARKQQKEAERAAKEQQKEAERAAKGQQKQQDEADRAAKEQQRESERATKEQQKQDEAGRAAKEQQKEAERAAKEQQKQQEEAERAARKQQEEAERAAKDQQREGEKAKSEAERGAKERDEADKAKAEAGKQQREAEKSKQDAEKQRGEAEATRPGAEDQAPPTQPAADRSRPELKDQDVVRELPRPRERRFEPKDEKQAVEQLKEERAKGDEEFEKAKREAAEKPAEFESGERRGARARSEEFEQVRRQRRERVEDGGQRAVIEEPDERRIILEKDRAFIRHEEDRRFARHGKRTKQERRKDGTTLSIYLSLGGVEIITVEDEYGRLVRRSRRGPDRREIILIDNSRFHESRPRRRYGELFIDLPPPAVRIPRAKYIVDYDDASEDELYETLIAPPVERLGRRYSLEEVRYTRGLRERMRRVDLDAVTFAFGSWEVDESQYPKLERIARVLKRVLQKNPDEMFMIEGHTDAVGSDIDNLSLSDRRAEAVAIILSDAFRVPPENLVTQGYGEQYLKVATEGPSRENRRVAVRRITPLLSQADERQSE